MRARMCLCLVAVGLLACSAPAFGQALLELIPVQASGTPGADWNLGPAANEITLSGGGQDVVVEMFISGWNSSGMTTYQASLWCATFPSNDTGVLTPILSLCSDNPGDAPFCQEVDTDRADQVFNGLTQIAVCDINTLCIDASPGKIRCGSTLLFGSRADDGGTYYSATYAVNVSADAKGQFALDLDPDPDSTFITLADTSNITPATAPALITIPTGMCCGAGGNLGCQDGLTEAACAGDWTAGAVCSGVDADGNGLDDNCCACQVDAECNDGNACTTDSCADCACSHVDITAPGNCCNPATGVQTVINDGEPCTNDGCDATGTAEHIWAPGNACDDGNGCTVRDTCLATEAEGCLGSDANNEYCDDTTPCLAGACNLSTNLCECSLTTDLNLDVHDGGLPDGNCFDAGDTVTVDVVMGAGSEVVTGGQFLVEYDPSCLEYVGVAASATFPMLIFEDASAGSVFAAVGIMPGGVGTQGPATLATLTFTKLGDCGECNLCFASNNPQNTILTNDEGNSVPVAPACSKMIRLNGDITLVAPYNFDVNPDCDMPTAIVTWDDIWASDTCDGEAPEIICTNEHSGGVNIDHLAANGGEFPQGRSVFNCDAVNSCGGTANRYWTVDVSDQHAMDVVVQLSPTIIGNPITRCICFEFYSDCVQAADVWCEDLVFGFPYDFIGHNTTVLKVAKGQFACLTARDPLHTLRSVSSIECIDNTLVAVFKGDPFFGGNWLIGGNLDAWKADGNADVIDILDFGMFVSQYGDILDPNTPCGTPGPHSDINGDGIVDASDFVIISQNFMEHSKNSCCDAGGASAEDQGIYSITVKELHRRGMGELAVADLNSDGIVDATDMAAFIDGVRPEVGTKSRTGGVRSSLGR